MKERRNTVQSFKRFAYVSVCAGMCSLRCSLVQWLVGEQVGKGGYPHITCFHNTCVLSYMIDQRQSQPCDYGIWRYCLSSEAASSQIFYLEDFWTILDTEPLPVIQTWWNKCYSRISTVPWPCILLLGISFQYLCMDWTHIFFKLTTQIWFHGHPDMEPSRGQSHFQLQCWEYRSSGTPQPRGKLSSELLWCPGCLLGCSHSALAHNLCILLQKAQFLHFASITSLKQHKTSR